jgi:hypothetical protein
MEVAATAEPALRIYIAVRWEAGSPAKVASMWEVANSLHSVLVASIVPVVKAAIMAVLVPVSKAVTVRQAVTVVGVVPVVYRASRLEDDDRGDGRASSRRQRGKGENSERSARFLVIKSFFGFFLENFFK